MLLMCCCFHIFLLIQHVTLDEDPDINTMSSSQLSSSTETSAFNLTSSIPIISVEILRVVLPPGIGNAVKLIWGRKLYDLNLNVTYGVHYGKNDDELKEPKLLTTNESVLIENLDFCTQYSFAVSVGDEYKINLNNIRSVVTYLDRKAPPQNLQVEFEPQNPPCLLIKWSASCANIGQPIGYVISLFDHETTHYTIITLPPSNRVDFSHPFQTYYGAKFDIKVSSNFPGSEATKIVTYKVPNFLEPYKVKISTNLEAGAFMLYWKEPYVPSFIDRLYYEVYIYKSLNTSDVFEKYYVTRPVLIYKGDEPQYMFRVGSVSYDGQYRSVLTDPLVADVYGEVHEVEID
ncbi:uncharacterized protein LOC130446532 isoform X1 [Diorhabda sublineata]|uniref:uncharacterized protein LOC130446532 isoform X1 n=1 Tax=Diorhabda sublineata TaxID=1163346 RepID=UPI0024E09F49|nr:uncharacterized protein LOC130446532 isoform X1 [Diorhabda sublineata]